MPDLEFEVAGIVATDRWGVAIDGWLRAGSAQPGDAVFVERFPDRVTTLKAIGTLSGPGPSGGGPNGVILLEDQELARELRPGDRVRRVSNCAE